MVLGPFVETKGPRRARPKPSKPLLFPCPSSPTRSGIQCCYLSFRKPIASRARQMAVYGPINGYLSGDYITFPCIPDIYQKSTTKALTTYSYLFIVSTVLLNLGKAIDRIRGGTMRSSTGRWVNGSDFFDRERELQILKTRRPETTTTCCLPDNGAWERPASSGSSGDALRVKVGSFSSPTSKDRLAPRTRLQPSHKPCILFARSRHGSLPE